MSSIIIATVPIHGHVTPLLAVARYFVERGDRVRFITGSRFAEAVAATGAEHLPLPPEADFDDREELDFPEREGLSGAKAIAFCGDDLGDVEAFKAVEDLRAQGLPGLLVCSGSEEESALAEMADLVVHGPEGVLDLLRQMTADIRAGRA